MDRPVWVAGCADAELIHYLRIHAKAIAKTLNAEGIPGPRAPWSPSTIFGHARRGTGILNNELYIGRRVWDRQQHCKNSDTGKRVSLANAQSEWTIKEARELGNDLWQAPAEHGPQLLTFDGASVRAGDALQAPKETLLAQVAA